jgi:hypothetical protein
MRRLSALLLGIALGGGFACFTFYYHLVRASDRWLVVPRTKVALQDAVVDIRSWGIAEWARRPQLARDMFKAGYGERVKRGVAHGLVDEMLDGIGLSHRPESDVSRN